MVPYRMHGQSLGFLLAEYFSMLLVFFGDSTGSFGSEDLRMDCNSSYVVSIWSWLAELVPISWHEDRLFSIVRFEDDRQLGMVDPTVFPINLGLYCCEPGVSQDRLVFS